MPDSVDSPAPLRMSTPPAATTSASIPNDPVVLASASWVTFGTQSAAALIAWDTAAAPSLSNRIV